MTDLKFDQEYWENRYMLQQTGWDAGEITTPLKEYFDQLLNKNIDILIPGSGNSYEAEYLHEKGFTNVYVLDIAQQPLDNIKNRIPTFPSSHLIHGDFFTHQKQYDLIVEQTFFCALDPGERERYAKTMSQLLKPNGKLVGVLFDTHFEGGPPFGGCAADYKVCFQPYFKFQVFEPCHNSIKPRIGTELFVIMTKL